MRNLTKSDLLFALIPVAAVVLLAALGLSSMRDGRHERQSVEVVFDGQETGQSSTGAGSAEKPDVALPKPDKPVAVSTDKGEKGNTDVKKEPPTWHGGDGSGQSVLPKGVKFTRSEVGKKVKVITPRNPTGEWVGVGDKVGDYVLSSIARQSVILSFYRSNGVYSVSMPRE